MSDWNLKKIDALKRDPAWKEVILWAEDKYNAALQKHLNVAITAGNEAVVFSLAEVRAYRDILTFLKTPPEKEE